MVTYLTFLAVFVGVPLLALFAVGAVRPSRSSLWVQAGGVGLLAALALVYTVPWDTTLIARGVWWYGDGVVAARLWGMPAGEYLFVVGQSLLIGVWTFQRDGAVVAGVRHTWRDRLLGALAGVGVGIVGAAFLAGPPATLYLGAILAWAGPVLALQWGVGWRYLLAIRRRLAVLVAAPVVYLATVDRIAIDLGLWTIAPQYTTGLMVLGLPVEEGVFFLVTTLFLVQALVLLRWVIERWG